MRVYHINVTARFSTGTIVKSIHNALKQRGDSSRLAFGYGGKCEQGFYQIANIWTLRVNARWMQLTGYEGKFSRLDTRKLIKDIKGFNPDIIHLHNIHGNYLSLPTLFRTLKDLDRPIVYTLHDCWAFTGGCYHFYMNGCTKWQHACECCQYSRGFLLNKLYKIEEQSYDIKKKMLDSIADLTVTTVSRWLMEVTTQSFLRNRKIYSVPNGIDITVFRPKSVDWLREKLCCQNKIVLLGVASTWSERKGLNEWFQLAKEIENNYQIVLVGLNDKQKEMLPANIIGYGRVKEIEDLVDFYNLADIYINLSAEETFGLPTAEAMACGTPVIVLNATANPELVTEKVGRVVEDNSMDALLKSIDEVGTLGKQNMSEACIAHVRENYSVDGMISKYLHIYDELFSGREILE